ncbi:MAG: hypothetical protein AB1424_03755 [Thermodesulfobacteriota bacterium]
MKKIATLAMAGIFVFSLQGPGRAQKEVAPPPISPLLEGQRPLENPETKEPAAPQKAEGKKAKAKSVKNQKKAKVKKPAAKKRQAAAKKKNQKATVKKPSATTKQQRGPDEG